MSGILTYYGDFSFLFSKNEAKMLPDINDRGLTKKQNYLIKCLIHNKAIKYFSEAGIWNICS